MTDREEGHREHAEREEKLNRAAEVARAHVAKVSGTGDGQRGQEGPRGVQLETEGNARAKPEGDLRKGQGLNPGARRQP